MIRIVVLYSCPVPTLSFLSSVSLERILVFRLASYCVCVLSGKFFLSFFVFGFIDNLKGPILPSLLRDLELNYSQGGAILFGAYLGFVIATLLSGILADMSGNGTVLILAGAAIVIGRRHGLLALDRDGRRIGH